MPTIAGLTKVSSESVAPACLFPADAVLGKLAHVVQTLPTGGTEYTVAVPSWAAGFLAVPSEHVVFAIDEATHSTMATVSGNAAAADSKTGGLLFKDQVSVRRIIPGSTVIHVRATASAVVVHWSFFGVEDATY